MEMGFVHLRVHSEYDVDKGMARLDAAYDNNIIARAAKQQCPALALTDTGNLFGSVKFFEGCRANGIKPIIGCELALDNKNNFTLLLCANANGYANLCQLISRAYADAGYARANWLTPESTDGIIALSGARRGDIGRFLLAGQKQSAEERAQQLARQFPNRFYLEVWRDSREDDVILSHTLRMGEALNLPTVATHPVQCADGDDIEALNVRLCIARGQLISQETRARPLTQQPYLLTAEQMREKFANYPHLLQNSVEIAKRCNFAFRLREKNYLPRIGDDADSSANELLKQAQAGLRKKYPADASAETRAQYDARLLSEIEVINREEYADYFLIVADFIRWAKEREIPVGPGRGSAAGSLVAYALDITMIDPIKYGLLFERFLNSARVSMPDIDIDFCVHGRDEVIRYVEEKYGHSHVSQIVTFGSIGAKAAIRDVGRVLGLPYGYCDSIAKQVPAAPDMTLTAALEMAAPLREARDSERGRALFDLALKVEGLPRNIGTHAGGVLIAPKPLDAFCPRIYAADTKTTVSQLDMKDVEKVGLVKFDFLGLRALTILQRAQKTLQKMGKLPADFDPVTIPIDDAKVYELYQRGDTIAVFQCESGGMRSLMRQLMPDEFSEIVALLALFRPGPLDAGVTDSYIQRKHGREAVDYITPELKDALEETRGVFVYQEQVMQMAQVLAGFSLGEADILRRAMGKKDADEMARARKRFVDGARGKLSATAAGKVFDKVQAFAGYGFNKSHAAAYAMVSYWSAYFKAYFPAVFLAATLSEEYDDVKRVRVLVKHLRALGIAVLPPDINHSDGDFVAVDEGSVRFGLNAIKGVGGAVTAEIIRARADRPFADIFDFCARLRDCAQMSSMVLEKMASAGVFDSLHPNRAALFATLGRATARAKDGGGALFGADNALTDAEWTAAERLQNEWKALGELTLTDTFLNLHKPLLEKLDLQPRYFEEAAGGAEVRLAGVFAASRITAKMRGRGNGLVILDDDRGEFEARVSSAAIDALVKQNALKGQDILVVVGKVRKSTYGGNYIEAGSAVYTLDDFLRKRARRLVLQVGAAADMAQVRRQLLAAPENEMGCDLAVDYDDGALMCRYEPAGSWLLGVDAFYRLRSLKDCDITQIEWR